MSRLVGVASITLGTLVLVLGFTVTPAHGQAPDQTGWWFEAKMKTLPVAPPAPPNVPAGGLYVQQGPDGNPVAYSALRYVVADASSATLTLTAAQGSTTTLGAPLQACATSTAWSPPLPAPGYWEDRPTYGKTCAPGTVSTDGKYVAFLLGSRFSGTGALDIAIVPTDGATPFAIAFDPPAKDSLVVKQASPEFPPPSDSSYSTPSSDGSASFAAPPFTVAPGNVATATAPTAPSVARPSPIAQTGLQVPGLGDPDHGERMAALVGSSAIIIGWWLLSSRRSRVPRLVGALAGGGVMTDAPVVATSRMGGVGRFARTRERSARALR
ncbi:MAG: hypothetical protein QOI47_1021 [Actinomycetota bacterium]|nr:hypothetical protein [Actinomycetota bacterium]